MSICLEILLAPKAGFCFGVKRAIDIAVKVASKRDKPVYTLGPIIHNPQLVASLCQKEIEKIDAIDEKPPGVLIIRSHGVEPSVIEVAQEYGHEIVDATCPFVKKAQKMAFEFMNKGYCVVVVGDRDHPEVKGIVGWASGKALVVKDESEAQEISTQKPVCVIAQTTQPLDNFNRVVNALVKKGFQVKACNTICSATEERQRAALEVAGCVDVMVVVGGFNSANTSKLTALCSSTGTPTYQVETADELKREWFCGVKKAGLTAGASTPGWIIEEVKCRMKELGEEMEKKEELTKNENLAQEGTVEEQNKVNSVDFQENAANEASSEEESMQDTLEVKELKRGDIVKGVVVQVNEDEVLVDIGAKSEGVISPRELVGYKDANPKDIVKVGDEIDVMVIKAEDDEGRVVLSKDRVDIERNWDRLEKAMEDGESVEGVVREIVNGGLIVDIGVRAFLPASLLDVVYVEDLTQYLNKTLKLKIIEMNKPKRKIIVSRKTLIEEERARAKQELFDKLEVGQVVRGTVQRLTEFGAFVDIGGVDGLLHISEIAWHRVDHPSDVLKEGDEIEVKVLKIDKDAEKVSLSLKQALPDPWEKVDSKYKVGDIIKVKVVRLAPFGAFVQLEPGVEGLIHISHLAKHHVEKPEDVVKEGEEVEVKVLSVDKDEKRIRLSIREAKKEAEIIERKQKQKKKQSSEEKDIKDDDSNDDSIALLGDAMPPELAEMAKMAKQ